MANHRQAGVTLVELLVTVGIIGILAAIAYPSYQRYVARTQRNAATACMSQVAQVLERHYTTGMSYDSPPIPADGLPCSRENDLNRRYTITAASDETTYTITALPINTQATIDAQCGTLTLNQAGIRTASGTAGRDACWR
jgi:type IV pilus assembly protein PilE